MVKERFQSGVGGLGARLHEAREAAGETQRSLGEAAGVTGPAIARYEGGDARPSLEVVELLAHALGVRAGWLAFGEEPRALR